MSLESRRVELGEALHLWKALSEHRGWQMLYKLAEEQRAMRQNTVCLTPVSSFGEVLAQEFAKGEVSGLALLITLPEVQMDIVEAEIKSLDTIEEMEKKDGRGNDGNGGSDRDVEFKSRVDDDNAFS